MIYFTCPTANNKLHRKLVRYDSEEDKVAVIEMKNVNFGGSYSVQVKDSIFSMENRS